MDSKTLIERARNGEVIGDGQRQIALLVGKLGVLEDEAERLLNHIQYYSYCTRIGVQKTKADYRRWEEDHKGLGLDIP